MAKNKLPSVDDVEIETEPVAAEVTTREPEPAPQAPGYASRHIDVRMSSRQALKFKQIQRHLDDTGKKLTDGNFVTNKRRAVLWLIENFQLPN